MAKKKQSRTSKPAASKAKEKAASPLSSLKPWQRQLITHASVMLLFMLVVILYFKPLVFDGKVAEMHDITQFQGMAKESRDFRAATGEEPLWASRLFSGMPGFQVNTYFPNNWSTKIATLFRFGLPAPANFVFLTFFGFYLLLVTLRVNPWLSGVGAAAYALSSYFFVILLAGHTSKAHAIGYFAPIIAGILMTYRGKWLLGGAVTALFLALEISANHYQISYYLAITILLLGIVFGVDAIRKKALPDFLKASLVLIVAAILGIGPNIGRLWTTYEYAEETIRGKSELTSEAADKPSGLNKTYALEYSYGILESFTLMIPNFYGGPTISEVTDPALKRVLNQAKPKWYSYWGDLPINSGPVYAGAIVCFLFVLGLFLVKGPEKWWLIAATLLTLMLSWGRNMIWLTDIFFYYFPAYNKFRAVSMFLVVVEFTLPLMAFLGLARVFGPETERPDQKSLLKYIYISAGITGGLALLFALVGPYMFSFEGAFDSQRITQPQLLDLTHNYRASLLRSDAWRSFGFIAAAAALLWLYVNKTIKSPAIVWGGLAVLILMDMIPVNLRYLGGDFFVSKRKQQSTMQPSPADNYILQDKDPNFRVWKYGDTWNDALTSYFHKSIGGYHAAKLRRYNDLISLQISPEQQEFIGFLQENQDQLSDSLVQAGFTRMGVVNMLNTRYFILDPQRAPFQNLHALGNAWFVNRIQQVNSPDEEIAALGNLNTRTTAVVDVTIFNGRFGKMLEGFTPAPDPSARITLTEFSPKKLVYESTTSTEQVAVFSEVYYNDGKGWEVYVDGNKSEHFRANYVLRAMHVPAGKHTIEFRFHPKAYYTGETLSLIFSIILVLAVIGAGVWEIRKYRTEEQVN